MLNRPESPLDLEHHYTPEELAKLARLSVQTIRRRFAEVDGVLRVGNSGKGKRPYVTLRIPRSVAERVLLGRG